MVNSPFYICRKAIFVNIRILFRYADITPELCSVKI